MKQIFAGMLALTALSTSLHAEVPLYHDGALVIDEVVTLQGTSPAYYRDVQLLAQAGGLLAVDTASPRPLARVDDAEVLLIQGDTLEASVHASGLLSVACVALEAPGVTRHGSAFSVVLAETVMDEGSVCNSLVAVTPFDISVPLDLSGLSAGDYRVHVNDLVLDFTLSQDQP